MALGRDSHLEVIPLLDESAASYVISHTIERFDSGHVAGELDMPDDNDVRILTFEGITNKDDNLKPILNYFYSGGLLRVYRLYPSVVTPWSQTDYFGYSDIVTEGNDTAAYAWYDSTMARHTFMLTGAEVV